MVCARVSVPALVHLVTFLVTVFFSSCLRFALALLRCRTSVSLRSGDVGDLCKQFAVVRCHVCVILVETHVRRCLFWLIILSPPCQSSTLPSQCKDEVEFGDCVVLCGSVSSFHSCGRSLSSSHLGQKVSATGAHRGSGPFRSAKSLL